MKLEQDQKFDKQQENLLKTVENLSIKIQVGNCYDLVSLGLRTCSTFVFTWPF